MGDYLTTDKDSAPAGGVFTPLNLQTYHYAGNNPIKYVDPTGEVAIEITTVAAGPPGWVLLAAVGIGFGIWWLATHERESTSHSTSSTQSAQPEEERKPDDVTYNLARRQGPSQNPNGSTAQLRRAALAKKNDEEKRRYQLKVQFQSPDFWFYQTVNPVPGLKVKKRPKSDGGYFFSLILDRPPTWGDALRYFEEFIEPVMKRDGYYEKYLYEINKFKEFARDHAHQPIAMSGSQSQPDESRDRVDVESILR